VALKKMYCVKGLRCYLGNREGQIRLLHVLRTVLGTEPSTSASQQVRQLSESTAGEDWTSFNTSAVGFIALLANFPKML
jgi:hypothetical protein